MKQKKLSKYEQLLVDIEIAEADYQELLAKDQNDLTSDRHVESFGGRLGKLLNRLELLTSSQC